MMYYQLLRHFVFNVFAFEMCDRRVCAWPSNRGSPSSVCVDFVFVIT